MDAPRRRKTVIAGTFAIARKSLSNPCPISVAANRVTSVASAKAEDTDAIHHPLRPAFVTNPHSVSGLCRPGAVETITMQARGPGAYEQRRAGWGPSFGNLAQEEARAKFGRRNRRTCLAVALDLQIIPARFLLSARNILRPEIFRTPERSAT
jgi:hypothetical protein